MKKAIAVLAAMIVAVITSCGSVEVGEPERETIPEVIVIQTEGAPEETEARIMPLKSHGDHGCTKQSGEQGFPG